MGTKFIKVYRRIRKIYSFVLYQILNIITSILAVFAKRKERIQYKSNDRDLNVLLFGSIAQNDFNTLESLISTFSYSFDVSFCTLSDTEKITAVVIDNEDRKILKKDSSFVLDLGKNKIGIAFFDKAPGKLSQRIAIMMQSKTLKKSGATFNIAFVNDAPKGFKKRAVSKWGFDVVVGVSQKVKQRDAYKRPGFAESRVLYSLGDLSKYSKYNDDEDEKYIQAYGSAAYGFVLRKHDKKTKVVREGYFALKCLKENGRLTGINLLAYGANAEKNDEDENILVAVQRLMHGVMPWQRMITLGDIFDVIGQTIPEKYQYLSDFSVNQICARTYELAPGNIFFFRRQFNDKNDKKLESEYLRNRLPFRAFSRRSLFVFSYKKLPSFIPHAVIDDPTEAHIKVMAWYKEKNIPAKVIAITGSTGKTSTKDMVKSVVEETFKTYASVRNTNVQVKIGINLQSITDDCQVYIQEIGGGRPGGASRHSRMVLPDMTVVTNIGTAHIGNYDSQEELMENKLGIIDGMSQNGVLYLNGDDKLLVTAKPKCEVVYFAIHNKNADYYAENIKETTERTYFDVVHGNERVSVAINVLGQYNILNALCAFAIGKRLGMENEDIKRGLENFKTSGIRQNTVKIGGITLFIDCYNASAESVITSTNVLERMTGKRKIAIIGDITGVGDMQEEVNERVAGIIDSHDFDFIICYGKESRNVADKITRNKSITTYIETAADLEKWLKDNIMPGDTVLFKGSSKVRLDDRIDSVFGLNTSDQRYLDEAECFAIQKKGMKYRVCPEHISVIRYYGKKSNIKIKESFMGKPVKKLMSKAFLGNDYVREVKVGSAINHIGSACFQKCANLNSIVISESVKYIGKNAFRECENLEKVFIEGELYFLGEGAFKNCTKLSEIHIPEKQKNKFIILEKGKADFTLNHRYEGKKMTYVSNNAYVASCLQNGTVIAYGQGSTMLSVYADSERREKVAEIFIIVLSSDRDSLPLLVNRWNGVIMADMSADLIEIPAGTCNYNLNESIFLDREAADAFDKMAADANRDGIFFKVTHGYRTFEKQAELIKKCIEKKGMKETMKIAAPVGFSEHHTGLAMDVSGMVKEDGTAVTENKDALKWIAENCYKYGFMIKNLKGKEHITGTSYEPWHIRYIADTEIARYLHDNYMTLDEYLEMKVQEIQ